MSNTFGEKLKLTIFGESHGTAVGGVIDGLPPGISLDEQALSVHMKRRAPGHHDLSTPRKEEDQVEIFSGYFQGKTTGSPLAFMIANKDNNGKDYEQIRYLLRPGHADFSAYGKYQGFQDYRGGGSFSGRLTAPLNFAGGITLQLLEEQSIYVVCHALSIGEMRDCSFAQAGLDLTCDMKQIKKVRASLTGKTIPVLDDSMATEMAEDISRVKSEQDSIGGIVECGVFGLPMGLGGSFFDSVESRLAHLCFSIPAVKAIEFGDGFAMTQKRGSEMNDAMEIIANGSTDQGKKQEKEDLRRLPLEQKMQHIGHKTNHNGGILGGITSGMPLIFRLGIKPTPSMGKTQQTVDIQTMKNTNLTLEGRHDPCIVPRVIPVVESAVALCILDLLL